MCTVTFIREKEHFFITSNRDEKTDRGRALPPAIYKVATADLLFPKDADAGGTWIALKDAATAAVLLNGGFVSHEPAPPYRRSRGLVLLDILAAADPAVCFTEIDLDRIEPFTLILLQQFNLFECRWDGHKKYKRLLDAQQNYIWSSATLYDESTQQRRINWFTKWQQAYPHPSREDILHFHRFAGDGDLQNDVQMNRAGQLLTVSVTAMHLTGEGASMHYHDLKDGSVFSHQMDITSQFAL
jgi:Transport and Golgi organisation 2